jgi:two-component system CheB/CheR fusion protein
MIGTTSAQVSEQIETLQKLLAELEADGVSAGRCDRTMPALHHALAALRSAEQELETARRKDEVLVLLSHELRSPLAAISNATHVLDRISSQTSRTADLRSMILRQTQHLSRLVDDLVQASRLLDGDVELHRERAQVQTIVAHAVESVRPLIEQSGQHFRLELPAEGLWAEVDPERIEQALVNLLNNAIQHTQRKGAIRMEARREEDTVVLTVADNGAGIPSDLLPHVFDVCTPPEHRHERAAGSIRVGLTWVRRLIELHGGAIAAFSEGVGKGSTFEIRLPAVDNGAAPRPRVLPASDRPIGPLRVLIVEDDRDTARSLAMLLRLKGCEVQATANGTEALEAAQIEPPDVVLLDIGLPGMDGYEVARELRARPELKKTLLVALTGFGQEEDRHRSRAEGFAFHLVKPVDPDILHQLLRNASERLGRSRRQR